MQKQRVISVETYHIDSFMATDLARCFGVCFFLRGVIFMKEARSNFLIHLQAPWT